MMRRTKWISVTWSDQCLSEIFVFQIDTQITLSFYEWAFNNLLLDHLQLQPQEVCWRWWRWWYGGRFWWNHEGRKDEVCFFLIKTEKYDFFKVFSLDFSCSLNWTEANAKFFFSSFCVQKLALQETPDTSWCSLYILFFA